jgi:hypothetical protein
MSRTIEEIAREAEEKYWRIPVRIAGNNDFAKVVTAAIEQAFREVPVPAPVSEERLAEIKDRVLKTWPLPWKLSMLKGFYSTGIHPDGWMIAEMTHHSKALEGQEDNLRFLANSREYVESLLQHIDHLTRCLHDCGLDGTATVWSAGYRAGLELGRKEVAEEAVAHMEGWAVGNRVIQTFKQLLTPHPSEEATNATE